MGLTIRELQDLDYGFVSDLMTEAANDHEKYEYKATQADFDTVFR